MSSPDEISVLSCIPEGMLSWNFTIYEGEEACATLTFDWLGEQGAIRCAGTEYEIAKDGFMSGHWRLLGGPGEVAQADKPNMLFNEFWIRADGVALQLTRAGLVGRSFNLLRDSQEIGRIQPENAFTRRATISCRAEVPVLVRVFAFALAVFIWRRMAHDSTAAMGT